ncbi:MAG: transglutaminase domain-containing protein [Methanomicrobiales archaeon]|nr:transglutaminase domain-containing protein [Methanomicrobiales archaeon]
MAARTPRRPRSRTGPSRISPVILLLASVLIAAAGAGCLSSPPAQPMPDTTNAASAGQQDDQSIYFFQNVVANASLTGNRVALAEDRTAERIRDAIDPINPITRDFAVSRIQKAHGGTFNAAQVADLWETVYDGWTYVEDPRGREYFSPASRTITLGLKGDCDDFAIVVASLIEAVGGNARIIMAGNGTAAHAYPEVYIGTTQEDYEAVAAYIRERYGVTEVGYHVTRSGNTTRYWLNLDWWSRHPGGKFFSDTGERVAFYPDGRWERGVS